MYNGEKIREILRDRGVKQKALLEAMGWTSNNQLKQVIEGNPTVERLEKICDFLEVPTDTLFIRKNYSQPSGHEEDLMKIIEQQKSTIDTLMGILRDYRSGVKK